jgi:hypothetical protein
MVPWRPTQPSGLDSLSKVALMQYDAPPRRAVMLTKRGHITVERLPNGLYRVYDARDRTTHNYNDDGTPRGSAVDAAEYRAVVREAISQYRASLRSV